MARIGRQISHFESVELSSVHAAFSSDKRYRYLLSMEFQNNLLEQQRNRSAVVILKNPSAADEQMADNTIRKVETYIFHHLPDVKYLHILNIFAFRATDPGDINKVFLSSGALEVIGEENDHVIQITINESDYIVLAWGNSSGIDKVLYEERIFRVKQLLSRVARQKIFQVQGTRETKHPLHGLMWGYDYKMQTIGSYLNKA